MNKNPMLIAGTVAAGIATLASLGAVVANERRLSTSTPRRPQSSTSSRVREAFSDLRYNAADTFSNFAASTAIAVTSVSDSWTSDNSCWSSPDTSYGGGYSDTSSPSCDTSSF